MTPDAPQTPDPPAAPAAIPPAAATPATSATPAIPATPPRGGRAVTVATGREVLNRLAASRITGRVIRRRFSVTAAIGTDPSALSAGTRFPVAPAQAAASKAADGLPATGDAASQAVAPAPSTELAPGLPDRRVDVYTFVTDDSEYELMRASFERAGFGDRARFIRLSDRHIDPYGAIRAFGYASGAPYTMLVHEDVAFDESLSADALFDMLEDLWHRDPRWVVAGPAGVTSDLEVVRRVIDEHGGHSGHDLPVEVTALDELMLIFNSRMPPRTTRGLKGFHFYGTDVCLCAIADGGTAWAIDVPVVHARRAVPHADADAAAAAAQDAYRQARAALIDAWTPHFRAALIGSPSEVIPIGRAETVVHLLRRRRILRWVSTDADRANRAWRTTPEGGAPGRHGSRTSA